MKHFIKYTFNLFAILFACTINAQVPDAGPKWTIQKCIQYAIDHNIQINTLRLNEQSAIQDLFAAKGLKIPGLSASASNTFDNANNRIAGEGNPVNQLTTTGSYTLNSSLVLWNGNYINNNIRQQDLVTQSAGLSVRQSQNNIILSITQAFLNILSSKENEIYVRDLVNTTDANVAHEQLLYNAGSVAKIALLQIQAQSASDKYLLVQTQNETRQNILSLKQILQLPTDIAFDIATPVSIEPDGMIPPLQTVQQTALQNFPEIKIGKLGVDIANSEVAKAKAGFKPVLRANGAIGTAYSDVITNDVSSKTGYFKQAGNNFYQDVGLTISIPIFSNRINKTNLAKSNIAYEQAGLNFQNSQLVLSQSVEQAYLGVVNAQQAYEAATRQLQAATESYRIINVQLKLGAISPYDLLQQRNQYVQAVQAYTEAKYTAILQQKIYEFYMGITVSL